MVPIQRDEHQRERNVMFLGLFVIAFVLGIGAVVAMDPPQAPSVCAQTLGAVCSDDYFTDNR